MKSIIALAITLIAAGSAVAQDGFRSATYEVPVLDRLKEFATFDLASLSVQERGDRLTVSYELPTELVGTADVRVEFTGRKTASPLIRLSGPSGQATCMEDENENYRCEVRYTDVAIDSKAVAAKLSSISRNSDEFAQRLAVAERFASEPIGILVYLR